MEDTALSAEIREAFPGCADAVSDLVIESTPDLFRLDSGLSLQLIVPAYMSWCVRNAHKPSELGHDYTLRALAEFGRSTDPDATHLNFKLACSSAQRHVVERYLHWCQNPELLLNAEQIQRTLKRWSQDNL